MCITNFHREKTAEIGKNQLECKISLRRRSQQGHPSSPNNPKFQDRTRRIKSKGESKKIRPCPPTSSAEHSRSLSETYGQRKRYLHHRPNTGAGVWILAGHSFQLERHRRRRRDQVFNQSRRHLDTGTELKP